MDTWPSSVALALVVALILLGTRFVDTGSAHHVTAQAILFLFVLGALVGVMIGLSPWRFHSRD